MKSRLTLLTVLLLLILVACSSESECDVLGDIPDPPKGAIALSDPTALQMTKTYALTLQSNIGAGTIRRVSYLVKTSFEDIQQYYHDLLGEGWEYDQWLQEGLRLSGEVAQAWISCQGERLVILYFGSGNPSGSTLTVLHAAPSLIRPASQPTRLREAG